MARVICPFCVRPHDFASSLVCPTTQWRVPPDYVSEYSRVPPLWLVTIGFSRHGKTTYFAALTLMLEELSKVWEDVYYLALDQDTMDKIRGMRLEAASARLPEKTKVENLPRPLLIDICEMPKFGSRCLVMHDVAGEVFSSLDEVQKYVPAIKQANTIWFLVSQPEFENDEDKKTVSELFNAYRSGMESLRIDLKKRNLIVVYTMGDKMMRLPQELKDYLVSDPLKGLRRKDIRTDDFKNISMNDYLQKMADVSKNIEIYTREEVPGGRAFINMVKAKGMNLTFSITSSLGEDPGKGSNRLLHADAFSYRVLDPFLWAIQLEKDSRSKNFGLILDSSRQSGRIYEDGLPGKMWDRLSDYGEITTYFLGRAVPVCQPGQCPPDSQPKSSRQRLIGPILEQAQADMRFLVVSTGSILDLADFYDSEWRDRIMVAIVGENYQEDWPSVVIQRDKEDPTALVEYFLRLEGEGGQG